MKFIGRDEVRVYTAADNYRAVPGTQPKWQDSTWLQWWDIEQSCGGVHRIGHEYNVDGGPFVATWNNLVTPKGIYKQVTYLPLRDADKLENGWGCGDDTCNNMIIDGEHVWNIDAAQSGVRARLAFTDRHGAFCGFPSGGRAAADIGSHHIDVSGGVSGTIDIQGKIFDVNGMGLRDHGWGVRDLGVLYSHRYVTGCFEDDLSFCCYAFHNGVDDRVESFGWAVKGDTVVFATHVDIVVHVEVDSASTRGGHVTLMLADGDVLDCELIAVAPGLVNGFPYFPACNNTLCHAVGNGRMGTGMVETSMNFRYGARKPERMLSALVQNGFYAGSVEALRHSANNPFIFKRTS